MAACGDEIGIQKDVRSHKEHNGGADEKVTYKIPWIIHITRIYKPAKNLLKVGEK